MGPSRRRVWGLGPRGTFLAADRGLVYRAGMGPRVLLGVSGSIAAYKAVEIARLLQKGGAEVEACLTRGALAFVTPLTFEAITRAPVRTEVLGTEGGEIAHVEQAHAADLILVAPASANLLARLAAGFADDALTATILATRAPLLLAPAMETGMWDNPATTDNVARLVARGAQILGPGEGALASGRSGRGRMLEPEEIVERAFLALGPRDFAGRAVLVTAGPTWEPLDPVRILSNRSTGAMGIEIAVAAARRGAQVTLVLGPTHLVPPAHPGLKVVRVETALQMLAAGEAALTPESVVIGTAAVSDFRPAASRPQKLKRSDPAAANLALAENPDVLATLGSKLGAGGVLVGFAAETEDVEAHALAKLKKKGCQLIIANQVGPAQGFGAGETKVVALDAAGGRAPFGPASKTKVAQFVLDQVARVGKQRSG